MPVVKMNVPCTIRTTASFDMYGEPILSAPVHAVCAVVKFSTIAKTTTVRTDSSATRGSAEEVNASIVLLMSKKKEPQMNDLVTLRGVLTRIISVQPRYDVMGKLDHFEIGCCIERQ